MLVREQGLTDKPNDLFRQDNSSSNKQPKLKISTLAPYLAEIERTRNKRSHLQRSKKTMQQVSSKSFRIKDASSTSLQKGLFGRDREVIPKKQGNQPSGKHIQLKPKRQRRTQSVNRHHEIQFSKTLENNPNKEKPTANNFFNQFYAKIRNKVESTHKESRQVRRNQFETLDHRARSEQAGELNMYKISYTNLAQQQQSEGMREKEQQKRSDEPKRKNFRRNKYQVASQEIDRNNNIEVSINLEMDKLAARQNQAFSQARNRELHGSIEKSIEKYFNYESYRPIRSKNDIEIYVSIVPNPSLHKASHSTNEKSDTQNRLVSSLQPQPISKTKLLEYDFDFKNEEESNMGQVTEKGEEFQQSVKFREQDQFQKQRRKVELQFFNKQAPHLDWSEDLCKIDDI